jgi:hypothetical protein
MSLREPPKIKLRDLQKGCKITLRASDEGGSTKAPPGVDMWQKAHITDGSDHLRKRARSKGRIGAKIPGQEKLWLVPSKVWTIDERPATRTSNRGRDGTGAV